MKTIKKFIDLGWHTVPMQGELKRLSNGKKNTPKFPENWKARYTKERNEKEAELGGVITGECSGIIAIDCDNTNTYNLFKALDPDYKFHFVSIGKKDGLEQDQEAGTIIYKYDPVLSDSFILHNKSLSLDFLSNNGMTYLPSDKNKTKEDISDGVELKEAPPAVIALLLSLKPIKVKQDEETLKNRTWRNHLQPQVNKFVKSKKFLPDLFRILTPKDYRDLPEYIENLTLHPDQIPDGSGSDYLVKISAILGADESIDVELYIEAMELINNLFSKPMPRVRLNTTIIEPMCEEKSTDDNGKPIWQYNENWDENKLTLITKRNAMIELFFDMTRNEYYIADVANENVKHFSSDNELQSFIEAICVEIPTKKEVKARLPLVDAVSSPAYSFGFFTNKKSQEIAFNTFIPTIPLSIFKNPEVYSKQYTRPIVTIKFLETLIPDNYMRNYLLKFLRRKFDKFEYSPAVLYFIGASGAGKDTIVNIIERLIGFSSIARPKAKDFLELYNKWILDKYFIQLDEYGDQLTRFDDKDIAKGLIKGISGKPQIEIREMRTDTYQYLHNITIIMTANKNPLYLDHDDRRVALFNCPNVLKDQSWVHEMGGITTVIEKIEAETNDFAYYLSVELDNLSKDDYMSPPETEDKKILIASKFNAAQKISYFLSCGMFKELEELAAEHDRPNLFANCAEGRIYEEELFDLYYDMTEGKGTKRGLSSNMKEFDKIPTTSQGRKCYYYNIPNLRGFHRTMFDAIEPEDNNIDLGDE